MHRRTDRSRGSYAALLRCAAVIAIAVFVLDEMGRVGWCSCGTLRFWVGESASSHTSQHLFDPYSFSHFQHGVLFFFLLLFLKQPRIEWALILEAAWEVLENTPWVIDRYRQETISLSYTGDSLINSVGDLLSCVIGFLIASRLPWRITAFCYVLIEVAMLATIRDSLTLNVIMLVYPMDVIRQWQGG